MKTITLNGEWRLSGKPQESEDKPIVLKAEVPGCVQLDLSRAGYLPEDLYLGENIKETEKFEDWEWWYERTFTAPEERENVYIVFKGVDCIADYYINGQKIGESEDMLVPYEFEIGKYLKDGDNIVSVNIKSSVVTAHYKDFDINAALSWCQRPIETALRRAPHSYGWDIMPRAVTAGLWRDVKIEVRDRIYFSQLFFRALQNRCDILYELNCKWSDMKNVEVVFKGACGEDSTFECRKPVNREKITRCLVPINNPKLWWPYGYGEPNIYDVTAQIYKDGVLVHEEKTHFGLRTVVLDKTDTTDGVNGRFRFLVNGVEIMCKGSNWVPMDAFHSRDAQRYDKALELAKDIGCNILRCWGGNVYEDDYFFNFCDRNGIMVWQDFAMACRLYPETEHFKKLLYDEAEKVTRKLRNHPSIILWSGDNEIDMLIAPYYDPNENTLTREVLPSAVRRNDIGRPQKTGIIWWNLLDGWPQMSDAVVDYYYDKKIAYGYIKRSQAPFVIVAGEISNGTLPIYACNDTLEGKSGTFTVKDAETDEILFESGFEVGTNQIKLLTRMPTYYSDHKLLIMKWNMGGEKGLNHYLCGYPPFNLEKYKFLMQKYGL